MGIGEEGNLRVINVDVILEICLLLLYLIYYVQQYSTVTNIAVKFMIVKVSVTEQYLKL